MTSSHIRPWQTCGRWATGLARLALRLAWKCLSQPGASLWYIPPPDYDRARSGQGEHLHDQPALFDPAELDAWLERLTGEAGTMRGD